jgi:S-adenosylmethionine decarboxylase proenzyme
MFTDKTSSGKHMICDIYDIKNNELLTNKYLLSNMLKNICFKNNFDILKEVDYSFEPIGCTILFLLSESHISIHTFPEKKYISFDIYTCRQYKDNKEYIEIYNFLISNLNASLDSEYKIFNRNFKNENIY